MYEAVEISSNGGGWFRFKGVQENGNTITAAYLVKDFVPLSGIRKRKETNA